MIRSAPEPFIVVTHAPGRRRGPALSMLAAAVAQECCSRTTLSRSALQHAGCGAMMLLLLPCLDF